MGSDCSANCTAQHSPQRPKCWSPQKGAGTHGTIVRPKRFDRCEPVPTDAPSFQCVATTRPPRLPCVRVLPRPTLLSFTTGRRVVPAERLRQVAPSSSASRPHPTRRRLRIAELRDPFACWVRENSQASCLDKSPCRGVRRRSVGHSINSFSLRSERRPSVLWHSSSVLRSQIFPATR